jgi:hypothetical protein
MCYQKIKFCSKKYFSKLLFLYYFCKRICFFPQHLLELFFLFGFVALNCPDFLVYELYFLHQIFSCTLIFLSKFPEFSCHEVILISVFLPCSFGSDEGRICFMSFPFIRLQVIKHSLVTQLDFKYLKIKN